MLALRFESRHGRSFIIHLIFHKSSSQIQTGGKQALVRAIPCCGEYSGPRFGDKFQSANQIDGISTVGGGKMADS